MTHIPGVRVRDPQQMKNVPLNASRQSKDEFYPLVGLKRLRLTQCLVVISSKFDCFMMFPMTRHLLYLTMSAKTAFASIMSYN